MTDLKPCQWVFNNKVTPYISFFICCFVILLSFSRFRAAAVCLLQVCVSCPYRYQSLLACYDKFNFLKHISLDKWTLVLTQYVSVYKPPDFSRFFVTDILLSRNKELWTLTSISSLFLWITDNSGSTSLSTGSNVIQIRHLHTSMTREKARSLDWWKQRLVYGSHYDNFSYCDNYLLLWF